MVECNNKRQLISKRHDGIVYVLFYLANEIILNKKLHLHLHKSLFSRNIHYTRFSVKTKLGIKDPC